MKLADMFMMRNEEDYLIQLDSANVLFPNLCAICRESAERIGTISKSVRGFLGASPSSFSLSDWRTGLSKNQTQLRRSIHIPLCEKHFLSARSKERLRPTCIVVNGFSIVTTMFIGLLMVAASIDQFMIGFQWFLLLEASIIIAVTSLVWLRPNELERAVSILRIEPGSSEIVLRLKYRWYLDEILLLNPNSAKRVKIQRKSI